MWLHFKPEVYTEAFEYASQGVVMKLRRKGYHCCHGAAVFSNMKAADHVGHLDWRDDQLRIGLMDLAIENRLISSGTISKL